MDATFNILCKIKRPMFRNKSIFHCKSKGPKDDLLSFQRNVAYFSYLGHQETENEILWKETIDWKLFVQ
jgi:hypothetical protein